jgi:hypothetical protein
MDEANAKQGSGEAPNRPASVTMAGKDEVFIL